MNNPKTITSDEKRKLVAILAEMKARGISVPSAKSIPLTENKNDWNQDENGWFIKRDGKHFQARQELIDFINCNARFVLLRSGRGGGKSTAGIQKGLLRVKNGQSGAVFAPDFEQFKTSTWVELREWIPWNQVVPKQRYRQNESWEPTRPFTMVFKNGARIYCKGLKDPESARGPNINWFMYDEGRRDVSGLGWKNAVAAVRVGKDPQAWCTTTPAGNLHWTTTFFSGELTTELLKILEDLGADNKRELFKIIETSINKNKDNLDPMFYASILASYPKGYLRAREVDGLPADEEGSIGDRSWFKDKDLPAVPLWVVKQVRFWDLAATEKKMLHGKKKTDPDSTIGTLLGTNENKDKFCIADQRGGQWAWKTIKEMIVHTAKEDGYTVEIRIEQEPGSGGKNQVAQLVEEVKKELPEWTISGLEAKKLGDRVLAANTWFGEASQGMWWYVKGLWNEPFFAELDYFPNPAIHDDRITSTTGARHSIAPIRSWKRIPFLAIDGKQREENKSDENVPKRTYQF